MARGSFISNFSLQYGSKLSNGSDNWNSKKNRKHPPVRPLCTGRRPWCCFSFNLFLAVASNVSHHWALADYANIIMSSLHRLSKLSKTKKNMVYHTHTHTWVQNWEQSTWSLTMYFLLQDFIKAKCDVIWVSDQTCARAYQGKGAAVRLQTSVLHRQHQTILHRQHQTGR